jgi:hypothetical protein
MSLNQRDTKAKDAVGVTGNILEMTVTNLKKELFAAIDVEQ